MQASIDRFVRHSARVDTTGIDYAAGRQVGLSDDEAFVLTYFADVENQSQRYLRTLLEMPFAYQPEVAAFLATWNYEEFFHGYELERLLRACDRPVESDRRQRKRRSARLNERLEALLVPLLSRVYRAQFPAVYCAFGALQELTTLAGYEALAERTRNPALSALCQRIARQERRHFAWYYQMAERLLLETPGAQGLVRRLLRLNWVPVGAGIHQPHEVARLFRTLFYPRDEARAAMQRLDARFARLPGLSHLRLLSRYFERAGLL